jgi:ribosomal protein S27E
MNLIEAQKIIEASVSKGKIMYPCPKCRQKCWFANNQEWGKCQKCGKILTVPEIIYYILARAGLKTKFRVIPKKE